MESLVRNLPTDLLRTFVVINQAGGFTQAGHRLGRSQPAISLQMKRLEELLDAQLFDRTSGLKLTEGGQLLMSYAQKILELNDAVVNQLQQPKVSGLVRLGIPNDLEMSFLAVTLTRFSQSYPDVTLKVNSDISSNLLRDFHQEQYDLVMAIEEANQPNSQLKDYIHQPMVWVHSQNFIPPAQSPLPLIVYPSGCLYRKLTLTTLNAASIDWRIIYRTGSLMGIFSAIKAGLGVSALARSTVPNDLVGSRELRHLPALPEIAMGFCYHDTRINSAARLLLGYLKEGLNQL